MDVVRSTVRPDGTGTTTIVQLRPGGRPLPSLIVANASGDPPTSTGPTARHKGVVAWQVGQFALHRRGRGRDRRRGHGHRQPPVGEREAIAEARTATLIKAEGLDRAG